MPKPAISDRFMPNTHIYDKKRNPPECPFYKASGGFFTAGVPGIEPGSGVLETLGDMQRNACFTTIVGRLF